MKLFYVKEKIDCYIKGNNKNVIKSILFGMQQEKKCDVTQCINVEKKCVLLYVNLY